MENDKKLIKAVNDRNDKKETYRQQMGKYKRAMSNGFYFEAMLITYAMIEDRMRSFLYYIGAFRREDDPNLNVSITKPLLRNLYYGSEENAKGKKLDINQISSKEHMIRVTLEWVAVQEGMPEEPYLAVLKKVYEGCLDIGGLLETLDDIAMWRKYRNEVIHGLLNKNLDSLNEELQEKVELGMQYARFIDAQVKALKKNDSIRKTMRIKR